MRRGIGYEQALEELYGRRRGDGRRDDRRMRQRILESPGIMPGFAPNPMFANTKMNPMYAGRGRGSSPSMDEVKNWLMETCGSQLEEATGSLKIRGFPDDITQFVVHKPTMQLQTAFKHRKSRLGSKLVFHGTPLPNLQSILQGGFKCGLDGAVWVAREPLNSVFYALKGRYGRGRMLLFGARENTPQSPYLSYGVLLGCEFVDDKRFRKGFIVEIDETTSTSDRHAIMVRYVFLLPPGVTQNELGRARGFGAPTFPRRFQIRDQMKENMENIEARIEERRCDG